VPRKIAPPAQPPIEVSDQQLHTSSATLRVTSATQPEADEAVLAVAVPRELSIPDSFLSRLAARPYTGVATAPMIVDTATCFTIGDCEPYAGRFGYVHYLTAPREFVQDCTQSSLTLAVLEALVEQATSVVSAQVHAYDEAQLLLGFHVPPNTSVPWLHMHALYPKSIVMREPMRSRWTSPKFETVMQVVQRMKPRQPSDVKIRLRDS
jgi:hypothetical protein